jgi:hypothetical protein
MIQLAARFRQRLAQALANIVGELLFVELLAGGHGRTLRRRGLTRNRG